MGWPRTLRVIAMIAKMVAMTATMEATTMPAIRPSLMELSVLDGPDGMGGGDAGEGGKSA